MIPITNQHLRTIELTNSWCLAYNLEKKRRHYNIFVLWSRRWMKLILLLQNFFHNIVLKVHLSRKLQWLLWINFLHSVYEPQYGQMAKLCHNNNMAFIWLHSSLVWSLYTYIFIKNKLSELKCDIKKVLVPLILVYLFKKCKVREYRKISKLLFKKVFSVYLE